MKKKKGKVSTLRAPVVNQPTGLGPKAQKRYDRLSNIAPENLTKKQTQRLGNLQQRVQNNVTSDIPVTPGTGAMPNAGYDLGTPGGAIGAQNEAIQKWMEQQSQYNRPNEYNPFGSQTFERDPVTGQVTQRTQLDPAQQALLDQQNQRYQSAGQFGQQQMQGLQGLWSQPFNLEGIGNDPSKFDFNSERARIEDESYNRLAKPMQQQFAQEQDAFRSRMAAEGIPEGTPKYQKLAEQMMKSQNDALSDIRGRAVEMGGQEMQRQFGLGQDARRSSIDERLLGRDRPYQELSNMLSMSGGPTLPQFQGRSDIQSTAPDILGAGMGYQNMANQMAQFYGGQQWQGRQNALDRATQERMARIGASAAGGGGGPDPFAILNAQTAAKKELMGYENELNKGNQPSSSSQWGQFGGSLVKPFVEGWAGSLWK